MSGESPGQTSKCSIWRCDNPVKEGHWRCQKHPPLKDHGLNANEVECPNCGSVGAGTIHDDLWYCREGCGELIDPYNVSDVPKEPEWQP